MKDDKMRNALLIIKKENTLINLNYLDLIELYKKNDIDVHIFKDFDNQVTINELEGISVELGICSLAECDIVSDSWILLSATYRVYHSIYANFVYIYQAGLKESYESYPKEQSEFIHNLVSFKGIQEEEITKNLIVNINLENYQGILNNAIRIANYLTPLEFYNPLIIKNTINYNKRYFNSMDDNFFIDLLSKKTNNVYFYSDHFRFKKLLKVQSKENALIQAYLTLFYIEGKKLIDFKDLIQVFKIQTLDEKLFEEYLHLFIVLLRKQNFDVKVKIQLINVLFEFSMYHDELLLELMSYIDNEELDIKYWKSLMIYLNGGAFRKRMLFSEIFYKHLREKNIKIAKFIENKLNIKWDVKLQKKQNKIVILTDQLLGIMHAPSSILKTLVDDLLINTENEILIVIEENLVATEDEFIPSLYFNGNLSERAINAHKEMFKSPRVTLYIANARATLIQKSKDMLIEIKKFNPDIILSLSSFSTIQNILYKYFPVVNVSNGIEFLPSKSHIYLYKNDIRAKKIEKKIYNEGELGIFPYIYDGEFIKRTKKYTKKDIGYLEDDFLIITSGNRIETEIDHELIDRMKELLQSNNKMNWILVGSQAPKYLIEQFDDSLLKRIRHIPYETDLIALNEVCDVSINPNRIGGGYSVSSCMIVGTPVVMCNFESDGLVFLGRDNVSGDTYADLMDEIIKMYKHPLYRYEIGEKQKNYYNTSTITKSIYKLLKYLDMSREEFKKNESGRDKE
ncbi:MULTISPECIES: hypothetical protein [Lysinibacillus]|uniref:Glycosyl transferase family 1 domain-containing protein n=1 Tax=Lysinibacillus xylanilyticus TaxID=582475 RepID=A0ABV3VWW2_9BACI